MDVIRKRGVDLHSKHDLGRQLEIVAGLQAADRPAKGVADSDRGRIGQHRIGKAAAETGMGPEIQAGPIEDRLRQRGYMLFDVQMTTDHTERMGAIEIPRDEYLERLREAVRLTNVTFV